MLPLFPSDHCDVPNKNHKFHQVDWYNLHKLGYNT